MDCPTIPIDLQARTNNETDTGAYEGTGVEPNNNAGIETDNYKEYRIMSDSRHLAETNPVPGILIKSAEQSYVFPWSLFIFAEGDAGKIHIAFSTHSVVLTGKKLDTLLPKIVAQSLSLVKVLTRAETFTSSTGLQITDILVEKIDD
jgi:hypothetical protein